MSYWEILESSTGFIVFGIFSIVAIIYMVKFSIEIDDERYRQQIISGTTNFQTASRSNSHSSPQVNNNLRFSPQINTSFGPMDSVNTSFSSPQLPYANNVNNINNVNTLPPNNSRPKNVLIPPRKTPVSPISNQFNNYLPNNNFRNSFSQNNRQSRQYLLNNNY